MGDETGNATLELVIAIDASGSITETGFDILKTFAAKIVRRMMATVQVGVVLFGNGKLDAKTNVISDAKVMTDNLESDMEAVATKIEAMVIHKGFTNMAQAFTKSKDVLTFSRKGADTTVMIISDGRPSFKFQTTFAVHALRKSARLMIVHVQANRKKEMAELLKGYASEPWEANYRHIPGKKKLAGAYDSYVTSQLADICGLKLISPSALAECTDLTGKGLSKTYPCECQKALCKEGEMCDGEGGFCVPPAKK
jgi:Mg-chelatase subunit ChlD